jgi:hypothetical protein
MKSTIQNTKIKKTNKSNTSAQNFAFFFRKDDIFNNKCLNYKSCRQKNIKILYIISAVYKICTKKQDEKIYV